MMSTSRSLAVLHPLSLLLWVPLSLPACSDPQAPKNMIQGALPAQEDPDVLENGSGSAVSGGDEVMHVFVKARRQAVQALLSFDRSNLRSPWSDATIAWIEANRSTLAVDVSESRHAWHSGDQAVCAQTERQPKAPVSLHLGQCKQTYNHVRRAGELLVHESAHHLGIEDEEFAISVGLITYEAFANSDIHPVYDINMGDYDIREQFMLDHNNRGSRLDARGRVWSWGGWPGVDRDLVPLPPNGVILVESLGEGNTRVAAAMDTTCVVNVDGGVLCWGDNQYGALGAGLDPNSSTDPTDRSRREAETPVQALGLERGVRDLAGAWRRFCAVKSDGTVLCWGINQDGFLGIQRGPGAWYYVPRPLPVQGLPGPADKVAMGMDHICALLQAGEVWCWGNNTWGGLGDGTTTGSNRPKKVNLPGPARDVVSSDGSVCAVVGSGTGAEEVREAYCWGGPFPHTPRRIEGLFADIHDLEGGKYHFCALSSRGAVACFGPLNLSGQLGRGFLTSREYFGGGDQPAPAERRIVTWEARPVVNLFEPAVALSVSQDMSCAYLQNTGWHCWGELLSWRVPEFGRDHAVRTATSIDPGFAVQRIATGSRHTCATAVSGETTCWGMNESGELGNGTYDQQPYPRRDRPVFGQYAQIAAGSHHSCGLSPDRRFVYCWGSNSSSMLGMANAHNGGADESTAPVRVVGLDGRGPFSQLVAGSDYTCVLNDAGEIHCFGFIGGVFSGEFRDNHSPVRIANQPEPAATIKGRDGVLCMTGRDTGALYCSGRNDYGALGTGDFQSGPDLRPVVSMEQGVVDYEPGYGHSCAIKGTEVWCWGFNYNGQLGIGTKDEEGHPVPLKVIHDFTAPTQVVRGSTHTCALDSGKVWCWGNVDNLGDFHPRWGSGTGSLANHSLPALVKDLDDVTALSAGEGYTCALIRGGTMKCWGHNDAGQVGNDRAYRQAFPVRVGPL